MEQQPFATPFNFFKTWLAEAKASEINDPDAACLATVDEAGLPNARMVLIRRVDEGGFGFFTNYTSRKGQELLNNPNAALCFYWKSLRRQVRIKGSITKAGEDESDLYHQSRMRGSRLAAMTSRQSQLLESREALDNAYEAIEREFEAVEHPPRPDHWGGFILTPTYFEFWQEGKYRLHDRIVYERVLDSWKTYRLYP